LQSSAFPAGGEIPAQYTCSGAGKSPKLAWTNVPGGTQTLVLIVDDPDAPSGTFTHWILYNLDPRTKQLPEGLPNTEQVLTGASQGHNDFGRLGYGGPCPPPGKPHRYFFRLYALNAKLKVPTGAVRQEIEGVMNGHIIGQAVWMGTFKR
jgi:Raf kinase inhibitor-like YbhB/YbcL family protein